MSAIFFDLETSDQSPVGQILNYCFIAVDEHLQPSDELSGEIRISRLELPRVGAILANRIDVLEHQRTVQRTEQQAMKEIAEFLAGICEQSSSRPALIGYNSNRFDVPYLRTSLMRNGINPYFGGRLSYRDLFQMVQFLYVSNEEFPQTKNKENGRLSLTLESLSKKFGLLSGVQTHNSRDDVLLTIDFARYLLESFDADIRSFEPYRALRAQSGDVYEFQYPEYDLELGSRFSSKRYAHVSNNKRAALWVDLERLESEEIDDLKPKYFNPSTGLCIASGPKEFLHKQEEKRVRAYLDKWGGAQLKDVFSKSDCDIEADIYRLALPDLDLLSSALWDGDKRAINNLRKKKDPYVLYLRHHLRQDSWDDAGSEQLQRMFAAYSKYRYGGEMQLSKSSEMEQVDHYPSLEVLRGEIAEAEQQLSSSKRAKEDQQLISSLVGFYDQSPVSQVLENT